MSEIFSQSRSPIYALVASKPSHQSHSSSWLCSTRFSVPVCDLFVKPYSFFQEQCWSKVDHDLIARVKSARELIIIHDNLPSAHSIVLSGDDLSVMLKDLLVF